MITDDLGLSKTDRDKLEKILLDFDEHWSGSSLDDIATDLVLISDDFSRVAVLELIKIDLHRHWEKGEERKVDLYRSILDSIGIGPVIPPQLILAEFLARHSTGKSPSSKEYRDRFPDQFEEFRKLFDAEKSRRTGLGKVQASISTDAGEAAIDTKTEVHIDPNSLPEIFGRYKILRRLGAGAMGAVYLAHDTQLDRHVALKTPSFGGVKNDEMVQRFYREARAAANLLHANICNVFDVGEIDGRHYITMDYIDGRPLSDYIGGARPLEQKTVAGIIRKLALAMAESHRAGVIHRDLKPANIMVDKKRQPLVMDFGLARRDDDMQSRMTQSGMILGTPAYMPPEQVQGKINEIGPQADIYSLGIILYELLTGRLPFEGSVAAVIGQLLTEQPLPPAEFRKDLDPALQSICLKMIAKDKGDRYQSMIDVSQDLADYLKGIPPSADIVPIDSVPVDPKAAVAAKPAIWTDSLALPASQEPVQPFKPAARKPAFWKTPIGRYSSTGAALLGVILIAWSITLIFRTPYGTLTITTDDPDIVVEVDGRQIKIRDDSPIRFTDGSHDIALKIGDQSLPIGGEIPFEIVGRDGQYLLAATYRDIELRGGKFTMEKGEEYSLHIALNPVDPPLPSQSPPAQVDSSPRTPSIASIRPVLYRQFDHNAENNYDTNAAALSPDGRHVLYSLGTPPKLRMFQVENNAELHLPPSDADGVVAVAFSGDGSRFVTGRPNQKVTVWETSQRKIYRTLEPGGAGQDRTARWVFYSDNGDRIMALLVPGRRRQVSASVHSWNARTGKETNLFSIAVPNLASGNYIAATPFGEKLLVSRGGQKVLWDTVAGRQVSRTPLITGGVCPFAFSADGRYVAGRGPTDASHDKLAVYDSIENKDIGPFALDRPTAIALSADGSILAAATLAGRQPNTDRIYLFDTRSKKLIGKWNPPATDGRYGGAWIKFINFSRDGKLLMTAGYNSPVCIWKLDKNGATGLDLDKESAPGPPDGTASTGNDYDHLATGEWVSVMDELLADPGAGGEKMPVTDGAFELADGFGLFVESKWCRNAIIRAKVTKLAEGGQKQKPYMILRIRPKGWTSPDGPRPAKIARSPGSMHFKTYLKGWRHIGITGTVLNEKDLGRQMDEEFEWAMSVIDDQVNVFVDGKLVVSAQSPGPVQAGLPFLAAGGLASFRDVQVMVLDRPTIDNKKQPPKP